MSELQPAGSIPLKAVEGRLDHMAWDARSQRLFIAGLENHTVEVVDLAKRRRVRQISGVLEPQGLAVVAEKSRLLVCSRGDGTCRSFDTHTLEEGPWIDLGRNADNIRFVPEAALILVGSGGEPGPGLFSAVDLASLLPVTRGGQPSPPHSPADFLLDRPRQSDPKFEIPLSSHPESFQADSVSRRVFVNVPDEHEIVVLKAGPDGFTKVAVWPVTVGEKNFPMAVDAVSARLFIACRKPPLVATYDAIAGKLLAQSSCVGDADDMFYDASARRLYIIGGEGFADVFQVSESGQGLRSLAHVRTAPRARTGLFIPELRTLAVAAPCTSKAPAAILLFRCATSPVGTTR